MSLSNCKDCKFNGGKGCAVNPDYWEAHRAIHGNLVADTVQKIEAIFLPCKDWEAAPDLEEKNLSITLTEREWMAIANGKVASRKIIPQVREALNYVAPQDFDDIPF
jgi:hypothetical protein